MKKQKPWDRQKGETHDAYTAFLAYRDSDPQQRASRIIANTLGRSKKVVERWMTEQRWRERADAWERHLFRVYEKRREDQMEQMADRHANHSVMIQETFGFVLKTILRRLALEPKLRRQLKSANIGHLLGVAETYGKILKQVTDVERMARGLATERTDVQVKQMMDDTRSMEDAIRGNPKLMKLWGRLQEELEKTE